MLAAKFTNALDLYQEEIERPKMYTGFADLGNILQGGIRGGQSYLFYGDDNSGLDFLVHSILVSSLKPLEQHGFGDKAVYMNCGNYKYQRTIFDVELIGNIMKAADLDPLEAMSRVHAVCTFNEEQQERMISEVCQLIEQDPEIKTVLIHHIAKLFTETSHTPDKNVMGKIPRLQKVISQLRQVCVKNDIALLMSARPNNARKGRVPSCEGGRYLRHEANVIVYLRRVGRSKQVQAYLVKHPRSPRKGVNFAWIEGENLGRITIPYRVRFKEKVDMLRGSYQPALIDQEGQRAFDELVKACSSELGAMSNARGIPTVLDTMLLTGLVDDRKEIMRFRNRFDKAESRLARVEALLEELLERLRTVIAPSLLSEIPAME